jgi:phosphatidylglycerol---prolipoprotein diacylglyceryl transferase
MSFPDGIEPTPPGVRVHPTPLYEFGMGLLIGWYLWWRGGKRHGTGAIVGEYLVLSGIARFLVEFIRRNPKIAADLSNAQLASLGSVVAGAGLIWWASRHSIPAPTAPTAPVENVA